jgi:O-acetyl-ADP-ribose deacetylase (regulator of RNase III)
LAEQICYYELYNLNKDHNMKIDIQRGDITTAKVECIVNAANPGLLRGAGVCGAIFGAAGRELDQYIFENEHHGCPTGDAVITPAFGELLDNGIQHVIHAVGPDTRVYQQGWVAEHLLAMTYKRSLELAVNNGINSIAFPTISTGVYGFDIPLAAKIAINSVLLWDGVEDVPDVVLVAFDEVNEGALVRELASVLEAFDGAYFEHNVNKD